MRNAIIALIILTGQLLLASSTHAAEPTTLVRLPISAAAIAAEPILANYQSWDVRVTIPAGHSWLSTGLNASLTSGSFYNSPLGSNLPLPNAWTVLPQLRYDTFVTDAAIPDDDSTYRSANIFGVWPEQPFPARFEPMLTSVSFAAPPPPHSGSGEFTIARLTFSNDAVGLIRGISYSTEGIIVGTPFSFTVPVPEPASLSLLGGAGLLLARRRR